MRTPNSSLAASNDISSEFIEGACLNVEPDVVHQPIRVGQVVQCEEAVSKQLLCDNEVSDVAPREGSAGNARTVSFDWSWVPLPLGSPHRDISLSRQRFAVPAQSGWEYTVEEINTPTNSIEDPFGVAETHNVSHCL